MSLPNSAKPGCYEIVFPLGGRAWGEVYGAPDMRVGRDVVIEISSDSMTRQAGIEVRAIRGGRRGLVGEK